MSALRAITLIVSAALHAGIIAVLLTLPASVNVAGGDSPMEVSLQPSPPMAGTAGGAPSPPPPQIAEAPPPPMAEAKAPEAPAALEAQPPETAEALPSAAADAMPTRGTAASAVEVPETPPSVIASSPDTRTSQVVAPKATAAKPTLPKPLPTKPVVAQNPSAQTRSAKKLSAKTPAAKAPSLKIARAKPAQPDTPPRKPAASAKPTQKDAAQRKTALLQAEEFRRRAEADDRREAPAKRQGRGRRRAAARDAQTQAGAAPAPDPSGFSASRTERGQDDAGETGVRARGRTRSREAGSAADPGAKRACAGGVASQIRHPSGSAPKPFRVKVVIASSGALMSVQRIGSSGSTDADQAAMDAVRSAAPFPPCPGIGASMIVMVPFQ